MAVAVGVLFLVSMFMGLRVYLLGRQIESIRRDGIYMPGYARSADVMNRAEIERRFKMNSLAHVEIRREMVDGLPFMQQATGMEVLAEKEYKLRYEGTFVNQEEGS